MFSDLGLTFVSSYAIAVLRIDEPVAALGIVNIKSVYLWGENGIQAVKYLELQNIRGKLNSK